MSKIIPTFVGERIALVTLRIPTDWDIRIRIRISSALSVTTREGESHQDCSDRFSFRGDFVFCPRRAKC